MSTCSNHQTWSSLHVDAFSSFLQGFSYQTTKMWPIVNYRDTSCSRWICMWHNMTKYIAPIHLFEPCIKWKNSEINRVRWATFSRFLISPCVNIAPIINQFQLTFSALFCTHSTRGIHAWKLWHQLLVYGQRKVCDSMCQFGRLLPVWDSLRQFVTSDTSQTVCDCHIADPVRDCSNWVK